jgi:hypothetical protein
VNSLVGAVLPGGGLLVCCEWCGLSAIVPWSAAVPVSAIAAAWSAACPAAPQGPEPPQDRTSGC